jgi:ribokinase
MMLGGVMVVGSANMDLVVRTSHFPQPGETVLGGEFIAFPGGKGANQAVAVGKLGGKVRFVAKVGGDGFGQDLLRSLGAAGVDTGLVVMDPTLPTGVAFITVDEAGENTIVVASGANMHLHPDEVRDALLETTPAVLLAQLEVPLDTVIAAIAGVPNDAIVIVNPAPARVLPEDVLARIDYLTPNEQETEALTGIRPVDDASCLAAANRLLDRGVRNVIVTLGDQGAFFASPQGGRQFSTLQVRPVDTTAAGDAFNGALARFLAEGRPVEQAIYLANAAGAMTTLRMGAQGSMPTLREMREHVGELF